jgi:hypothetical protein
LENSLQQVFFLLPKKKPNVFVDIDLISKKTGGFRQTIDKNGSYNGWLETIKNDCALKKDMF